jgi:hypothetical protein
MAAYLGIGVIVAMHGITFYGSIKSAGESFSLWEKVARSAG